MKVDRVEILKKMVRIRMVEQYIVKRYPEKKMRCPVHLCLGQEAAPAVMGYFADKNDIFVGTCRSHGHYLAKGGDLTALFAEILGSSLGCSKGFGGSMHIIDKKNNFFGTSAIVAGGVPIACGAALAFKYRNASNIVVVFLGDAAMEEGAVYETANFALLHDLPLLFVCENNRLAITTPLELRQSSERMYNRFQAMGMRGYKVDENDIEELIDISAKCYEQVREGLGPCFLEYEVSRWSVHVGHDFEGPIDSWWQDPVNTDANSCPICVLINDLLDNKLIDIDMVKKIKQEIANEIEEAYKKAVSVAAFSEEDLCGYVYASPLESKLSAIKKSGIFEFKSKEQSKLINPF